MGVSVLQPKRKARCARTFKKCVGGSWTRAASEGKVWHIFTRAGEHSLKGHCEVHQQSLSRSSYSEGPLAYKLPATVAAPGYLEGSLGV